MLYVERSLNSLLFLFSLRGLALPPSRPFPPSRPSPGQHLPLLCPSRPVALSLFCFPFTHTPPEPQLLKDGPASVCEVLAQVSEVRLADPVLSSLPGHQGLLEQVTASSLECASPCPACARPPSPPPPPFSLTLSHLNEWRVKRYPRCPHPWFLLGSKNHPEPKSCCPQSKISVRPHLGLLSLSGAVRW